MLAGWLQAMPTTARADDFLPCVVHQRVSVKFPVRAFHEGVTHGQATLMLEVHKDGQLGDVLVVAHTGHLFAEAARDAVKQWEYTPALLAGEPIGSLITVNVNFEVSGVTAFTKLIGQPEARPNVGTRGDYRPFGLLELDRVPPVIARPGPVYPKEWIDAGKTGAVTVEFYIDEDGHTRFARVVGNADENLGAAAVDAVKSWLFEPPTRRGRPVLAEARQVFYFRPERKRDS
jgi:TonB family protein